MAHARGRRRRVVLGCDRLEERTVMSASAGFLGELPAAPSMTVSTVSASGDAGPYGVASVPGGFLVTDIGTLTGGAGAGGTIEKVFLNGTTKTWYTAPKGFALTGPISALPNGDVVATIAPASTGTANSQDSLVVLNRQGRMIADLSNLDLPQSAYGAPSLAVAGRGNRAKIFISDPTNETVSRVDLVFNHGVPRVTGETVVASGYPVTVLPTPPPSTVSSSQLKAGVISLTGGVIVSPPFVTPDFVQSELGLAFDPKTDVLYVASEGDNTVYAVAAAGTRATAVDKGTALVQNNLLSGVAYGAGFAPNGDLLVSNDGGLGEPYVDNPSPLVEYTTAGGYVNAVTLDPAPGAISGFAVKAVGHQYWLATVNESANTLEIRKVAK